MPITYDLFGNPEASTPQAPINDTQSLAQHLSVADQARLMTARRNAGLDIPVGYSPEDMDPSVLGRAKAFARSIGAPTSGSEYVGANLRAIKAAGKTVGGAALSTAKLAAGVGMLPLSAPIDAARMAFRHGVPSVNPLLAGSIHDIVQGQADQFDKAKADWEAGNLSSAAGHGLAGAVPFAGPLAADAGEKLFTPESPEAIGELAGAAALPGLTKMAGGIDYAGKLDSVRAGLGEAGAQVANSTLPKRVEFFRRAANPGRVMAPLGATSMGEVPDLVKTRVIEPTYSRLQSLLTTPEAQTHSVNLLDSIRGGFEGEIKKAAARADDAKISRLEKVRDHQLELVNQATDGTGEAPPHVALAVKQGIGDSVDWRSSTDSVEGSVNDALMGAYRNIDSSIDNISPSAKALNERLSDGLTAINAARVAEMQDKMGNPLMRKLTGFYSIPAAVTAVASGHPFVGATIGGTALARSFIGRSMLAKGLSAMGPSEAPVTPIPPTLTLSGVEAPGPPDFGPPAQQPVFAAGNNDIGQPGSLQGSQAIPMNPSAAAMAPGYFGMTPEQISAITDRAGAQSYRASPQAGSPVAAPQGNAPPPTYAADGSTPSFPATPPVPQPAFDDVIRLLQAGRIAWPDFMQWMAQNKANLPQPPSP